MHLGSPSHASWKSRSCILEVQVMYLGSPSHASWKSKSCILEVQVMHLGSPGRLERHPMDLMRAFWALFSCAQLRVSLTLNLQVKSIAPSVRLSFQTIFFCFRIMTCLAKGMLAKAEAANKSAGIEVFIYWSCERAEILSKFFMWQNG
jgi:hypothetical protein